MAKYWPCSQNRCCGRCNCCRPMTQPDLHKGGVGRGGSAGEHSGCALWTLMTISFLTILLIMICG